MESKICGRIKRKLIRPTTLLEKKDIGEKARIDSKIKLQNGLWSQ